MVDRRAHYAVEVIEYYRAPNPHTDAKAAIKADLAKAPVESQKLRAACAKE
ncbi:MAG: hypothetical protein HY782_06850 [Chloroflexi bacterium]|nr:hypothetical protein [Chloroflexota bacterium]